MSNEERPEAENPRAEDKDQPIKVIVEQPAQAAHAAKVEVVSLSIDEHFDAGGDPYNRTGSFVALALKDTENAAGD